MKFAVRLLLGWIALCASSAHAASGGRSDVFNVGGVEYRRIELGCNARECYFWHAGWRARLDATHY